MIKFEDQSHELKNGKKVVIRRAEVRDAEKLLECIKTYVPQSNYIPKLEQEIKLNVEQEAEWINSFRINDNSILLIAEYDNQIIGNIDLTGNCRKIMEHTAVVGMGMLQEWRNSGLGTALLSSAIEWAKLNPVLELVWLQVYTENKIAINLYRKIGFKENGIIKNFFKQDGRHFDNLTMVINV
ncbi:GNAT family N-acetyltransferase [Myroides indicus]|uniref:RimJ/RimL family protein N-acetyltransferase n=1 Tax=Myroides indicus TaxID=1323422 RepID=A0A4R7EYF6_9FLAO|nr:GNAT family N-acetyltransferase [Myroides indicus]TDS61516.1 RimJ/RimL family protein N-acetyltransferase [Myroides indicus]